MGQSRLVGRCTRPSTPVSATMQSAAITIRARAKDIGPVRATPSFMTGQFAPHRTMTAASRKSAERLATGWETERFMEWPVERSSVCLLAMRTDENTSELQSLMRNSYAVYCLQKKNKIV